MSERYAIVIIDLDKHGLETIEAKLEDMRRHQARRAEVLCSWQSMPLDEHTETILRDHKPPREQVAQLTEERDRLLACVAEWQASCAERTKERDQAHDHLEATIKARDERSRLIEELEVDLSKEREEHAKVRKSRRWHRKAKSAAVGALMEEREQHKRVVADLKAQIEQERVGRATMETTMMEDLTHARDQLRMARAGKEPRAPGPCVQELRAEVLALQETLRHTTRALAALASDRRER